MLKTGHLDRAYSVGLRQPPTADGQPGSPKLPPIYQKLAQLSLDHVTDSSSFWNLMTSELNVTCVAEVKHALLGHTALGCPGLIPLIANLCRTVQITDVQVCITLGKGFCSARSTMFKA
jgi:hypothetical protein